MPALIALLLVLALVAGACNKPEVDEEGLDANDPDIALNGDGDGGGGDPGGDDAGGDNGGNTRTTANGGGNTPTTANGSQQTPPGGRGGTVTTRSEQAYAGARGGAGAYARTILRPEPATRVVLEILQQAGAEPSQNTVNHAVSVLRDVTKKNVTLSGPHTIPGADGNVSEAEIETMSDRHGKTSQGNGTAVIRILFLKGAFNGDDSVLGVAVRGDTAAIMSDQVRSAASPFASRSRIEDAVTEHEIGHLLGLVDIVLKTGREDPEHKGHSRNRNSVMYWAVESDLVGQVLGGPPPVDFDDADRADLAAIRNGA